MNLRPLGHELPWPCLDRPGRPKKRCSWQRSPSEVFHVSPISPVVMSVPFPDAFPRQAARANSHDAPPPPARSPAAAGFRATPGTSLGLDAHSACSTHRATGHRPGRDRRRHVLADRIAVHTQAGRQLMLRSAGLPVNQNLHNGDHEETPPHHRRLRPNPATDAD